MYQGDQKAINHCEINNEDYPFSQSYEFAQEQQTANNLLLFLITGLFVVGHFIALSIPLGIYMYMVILLVIIVFGWRVTFPKNKKPSS